MTSAHGGGRQHSGEADKGTSHRERHEQIRAQVVRDGSVRVEQLAAAHRVSIMTIHRDLDALQREGWLRKVRGGAAVQPSSVLHGDVHHRMKTMTGAKQQVALAAAKAVEPGRSILLDDSTTTLELARLVPEHGPVTVITNFLSTIRLLAGAPSVDLIALGGAYYPAYDAFLGVRTIEMIRKLHADVLFMSTTAITNGRCYHQSQETIQVKRALMEAASMCILLVDHSKFSKRGLHELVPLTAFDLVILDSHVDRDDLASVRSLGVEAEVAHQEPGQPTRHS
jgi:DeoR/GlpR family transcriptional regulator of sugar metabolism